MIKITTMTTLNKHSNQNSHLNKHMSHDVYIGSDKFTII
jgi:hypothetical protein